MRRLTGTLIVSAGKGQISPDSKAVSVAVPASTLRHLVSALKKQWRRYRKSLRRCQEDFSPAAVHESRVDTRRLLSIVGLLSPFLARGRARKMQELLKQHLDTSDDLRDTQVQLSAAHKLKRTFGAGSGFCEYLRKREKHFACETRRDIKGIKTRRLNKLVVGCRSDLKKWEQKDLPYAANALLLRMVHAAFANTQRLRDQIDAKDTKAIHRTRVAFKRFRYMLEILSRDLPHIDKKLLRAMHDYQTMMGDIQDAQVLLGIFEQFLRKEKIEPQPAVAFREHLLHRRRRLIQAYLGAADHLFEFWPTPAASRRHAQKGVPKTRSRWRGSQRAPVGRHHSSRRKKGL